ncbi:MAG: cytochrome ubiquinol oxidase subunit I [Myxococcota bacterium]
MSDLMAARSLMALSLAFHIVFAAIGMAMPLLMVLAEAQWLRTSDAAWRTLARRWARGAGILFAVGAVSGTVLSLELGMLFPAFMRVAGPVLGMPFSLEGLAFFTEAIFLGIYLYGWDRVAPRWHVLSGVMVALAGVTSAGFVVTANAWMNTPTGFTIENGVVTQVDVWAAIANPAAVSEVIHMVLAAYVAVGFGVAGLHAWLIARGNVAPMHRRAVPLALSVGSVAMVLQLLSGHEAAVMVAKTQPAKAAAMEALWDTQRCAPMELGGYSDDEAERVIGAIRIPCLLSLMTYGSLDAEMKGLKAWPPQDRPRSSVVHFAFDLMVGCGMALLLTALWWGLLVLRRQPWWERRGFLTVLGLATPLGFVAIEAGWVVAEVGRQPWVIQDVMRTSEAVTTVPDLTVPLFVFAALYAVLALTVVLLMRVEVLQQDDGARHEPTSDAEVPRAA